MTERAPAPGWLAAVFFALLVLPFDPFWVDFEQVRRGLLLVLAGVALVALPRLAPFRGERAAWALVVGLAVCGAIAWLGDVWFRDEGAPATFQVAEAAYRLAHWLALVVVLRLGAATAAAPGTAITIAALLAATSLFGLLQRVGLGEIAGYGVEREPVSVFGNLNVASEWTAISAAAVAVAWPRLAGPRPHLLAIAALGFAGAYLVVNGSRSGLVALPLGLGLLAILRRRELGWLPGAAALAGALLGLVLHATMPTPEPRGVPTPGAEPSRPLATLQVRSEIAKGTARLWSAAPVFGLGPGQFAVHYPRVRSQDEIELSSNGRRFAAEVRTAHDDWLELLVDGGLIALLLFAGLLLVLRREQPDRTRLVPLFVLLLLMLARAPLWNAPAAALALWFAAAPGSAALPATARAPTSAPRWRRWTLLALGVVLVALGVPVLVANHHAARYQAAVARGEQPRFTDVATAATWMPFEPRWLQLLVQEHLLVRNVPAARKAAAMWVSLRPFDPQAYEALVEALVHDRAWADGERLVAHALAFDAAHPSLRTWRSWLAMYRGAPDAAIAAVVEKPLPHPRLRERLAGHFAALAKACPEPLEAARYRGEHHFVAAVDNLGLTSPEATTAVSEHFQQFTQALRDAGITGDARPIVVAALHYLDLGKRAEAIQLAAEAAKRRVLLEWQRELLAPQLDRLRSLGDWGAVLDRR